MFMKYLPGFQFRLYIKLHSKGPKDYWTEFWAVSFQLVIKDSLIDSFNESWVRLII